VIRVFPLLLLLLCGPAWGQVFSPDGFEAEAHGAQRGYPMPARSLQARSRPFMVAGFSRFDELLAHRVIARPEAASVLPRAPAELALSYAHRGARHDPDSYLARHPATGLLVIRDGVILLERYRYGRGAGHRFTSQSMAKTMTAMLVGVAVAEGRIRSIDEPAAAYVPEFAGSELGATPIRALLHMASGLAFRETYDGADDAARMSRELWRRGGVGTERAVAQFAAREMPPDTRFLYAGRDTVALGLVLARATGETLAGLMASRIWGPIGAEADASWITDAGGQEAAHCCLGAVLRDWGRFGLLLARDGEWGGRQVIPRDWVIAATTAAPGSFLAPGTASRFYGYGYQTWILPGPRRQFALLGIHGQAIFVDPVARLVLVHTAVRVRPTGDPTSGELLSLWHALVRAQGK
jgi:CubicO group peptidase (beta-lactamase class C family)